jgi:hypothetical protein
MMVRERVIDSRMVVVAVVVAVVAFTIFLVYCLGSIFIARHFSNQIANHTIIQTSASRQSGIKLVLHNELDQKETCFPTVHWALDHCLSQLIPG